MKSPVRMAQIVAIAVAALVLIIVGVVLWKTFASKSATPGTNGPVPIAAQPLADYPTASNEAVQQFSAALSSGDDAALPAAAERTKNALMGLTVPADARASHLALILALSRFEQDPSPEARAALAAAVEAFSR